MKIGRNNLHGDYSKALHFRFAAFSGPKVVAQSEISSGRTGREETNSRLEREFPSSCLGKYITPKGRIMIYRGTLRMDLNTLPNDFTHPILLQNQY